MKLYKAVSQNENKCKQLHRDMCMAGNLARLEPNLFLIADTDELQKQVNRLENEVHRMRRSESRRRWVRGRNNKA